MSWFVDNLPEVQRRAKRIASCAVRRGCFPQGDREDIAQALLIDAWERMKYFDPSRSLPTTFTEMVMTRCSLRMLEQRRAEKRGSRFRHDLLEVIESPETRSSYRSRPATCRHINAQSVVDLRCDVERVMATLHPDLADVAKGLMSSSKTSVARTLRLSLSTLHRRVAMIRVTFEQYGFGPPDRKDGRNHVRSQTSS
jgi:DNA-directed RNA polymerase specialized sigma24 family protein